ncbi:MAG: hypothetical protein ABIK28_17865 [Planctomycetota bacterium]
MMNWVKRRVSLDEMAGRGRRGFILFRIAVIVAISVFANACVSHDLRYAPQIEALANELGGLYPSTPDEVVDFACLRSCRLNLDIDGLCDEVRTLLEEPGPWYRTVLFTYLLALARDEKGFALMIELLEDATLPPLAREGVIFSGLKYMGFTERDEPVTAQGWEVDLDKWKENLDQIEEIGLAHWRLEYLRRIVHSGKPGSGDEALAAAPWLSNTLQVRDVTYVANLLDQGSPKCDLALLIILEHLLMRDFLPDQGEESLSAGKEAFRKWYVENICFRSDQWITDAFVERGYDIEDLYNQTSISKINSGLYDDSEDWMLVRSHTLEALNRICGFYIDRNIIFKSEEIRMDAGDACQQWYQEQAALLKVE